MSRPPAGAPGPLPALPPSAPGWALASRDSAAPGCWLLAARCRRASGVRPCDAAESPRCRPPPAAAESARCRPARLAAAGAAPAAAPAARRNGEDTCCRPAGMPSAAQAAWRAGSIAAAREHVKHRPHAWGWQAKRNAVVCCRCIAAEGGPQLTSHEALLRQSEGVVPSRALQASRDL